MIQRLASLCKVILPPLSYFAPLKCGCISGCKSCNKLFTKSTLFPSYLQKRWSASSLRWLAESTHSLSPRPRSTPSACSAPSAGSSPATRRTPPASSSNARRLRARAAWKNSVPCSVGMRAAGRPQAGSAAARATTRTRSSSAADQSSWRFRRWSKPRPCECCHAAMSCARTLQRKAMIASRCSRPSLPVPMPAAPLSTP
mmetsp:Transcript_29257/g.93325  ORF Transcript_29257/g.93325 Transcript_29257/m.93325 type:complete len:200 (-) Transcript_29257:742-1341(-)